MKLNFNISDQSAEYKALKAVLDNLNYEMSECACAKKISLKKTDERILSVSVCDGCAEIAYFSITSLIRGLGLILSHLDDKCFKKEEKMM